MLEELEELLEKLPPGSDSFSGMGRKTFLLDSQMGLRFNLGSDQAAMLHLFIWLNNNFFPSQRYVFSVIVTFGNYSYSCQVG